MAVDLRATAYLNAGPYLATLKTLGVETAKTNAASVKGSKKNRESWLATSEALEANARKNRELQKAENDTANTRARNLRTQTVATRHYQALQQESIKIANRVQEAYRTMSTAEARHVENRLRTAQARLALMRANEMGLEGPALTPYIDKVAAAEIRQAKSKRTLTNALAAQAAATAKVNSANEAHQKSMATGAAAADDYVRKISKMTPAQLALATSAQRLEARQLSLAQAFARSGGVVTADVLGKQAALNTAQANHNRLLEEQSKLNEKVGASAASGLAAQRYMFHDLSRQLAVTGALMVALPAVSLGVSAAWERTFADVKRTADPAFSEVEERSEALRRSLIGMAQSMPSAFGDIAEIATLANQMGIASTQTAEFTRAVTMFSATSGVTVDMAATAFGRLTSIMGDSRIGFMEMADAVLKVGVNSVATEEEIINITTQISSIAQQAGMTTQDIIGLSGALASVRVPPELSRGVITRVFGQIDKAVNAGGTGLQQLARISGTTAEEFRRQWGSNESGQLFNNFMRGLRDAGSTARSELNSLGITSVRDVPVLLRLANAADADGLVGELLTQTMRDANNAAGETQRQYTIMADTVVGKLKVLGNNIMAFFDAAGRSGLGVFGKMIDSATKSIRDFTNSLDEPHFLLGMFGQTNADVIGLIGTLALATGAFVLLGSAISKVFAAGATIRHATSILSSWGIFGGGGGAGGGAVAGLTGFATGAGKAAKGAGVFRGALKGVVGLLNPYTIGITAGIAALTALNAKMREGATDSKDLAESLAQVNFAVPERLDSVLSSISVEGPARIGGFDMNHNPFEGGVTAYREAIDKISAIRDANQYTWFGGEQTFELGQWLDRTVRSAWGDIRGIEKVDEAIQSLVDSGNSTKAIQLIQELAASGKDLKNMLSFDEMRNSRSFLSDAFDLAGIEMTEANLDKLARGTLPELIDAMTGVKGSSLNADELFEGDFERLGQFAAAFDAAAAAFINFEEALESNFITDAEGAITGFDLAGWTQTLQDQVNAQKGWLDNIEEIAKHGSHEVIEALAEMGPAGHLAAEQLAEGLRNGEPLAIEALAALEESVVARAEGYGNAVAEVLANIDWLRGASDSEDIFDAIIGKFTSADLSRLREAGNGLGREAIAGVLEELSKTGDIEQAIRNLQIAKPLVQVDVTFQEDAIDKGIKAVEAKLRAANPELPIILRTNTTIMQLRGMLDDPTLNSMEINTELTLAEAYAQHREFQVWAEEQGIDIFLGANDTPARLTLAALVALATGTITQVQIAALPDLAEESIWQIVQYANGVTGFVEIDANNGMALSEVAYVVDEATGTIAEIPLTADNIKAIEAVNAVGDKASDQVAEITVTANDSAAWAALNRLNGHNTYSRHTISVVTSGSYTPPETSVIWKRADGGVSEYYANGGIRENHVAQIAPAGTNRVWAEPETGGEAYIPLSLMKRKRSTAILGEVANRFGYSLAPNNTAHYNNGGIYQEQHQARMMRAFRARSNEGGAPMNETNWNMTFVNPVTRDPFEDAWDKAQSLGRL